MLDISQVTCFLNDPRYVFDGKPPDMKSGEVLHTCTCNTLTQLLEQYCQSSSEFGIFGGLTVTVWSFVQFEFACLSG